MESDGKLPNSCEKVEEKSELKNGSGVAEFLQSDQQPDNKKNVSECVEELKVKVQQDAVMMEDGGLEENPHSVLSETAEKQSTVELSEQQTSSDPDEKKNVSESVEELKVQQDPVMMEDGALEENPHSVLSETAEKSTVELSEQQAVVNSGICGTKRKAETLEINNEESQRKWYCSLCEVSTTSEGTLNHHMLGKKHKAKEAKSNKSKGTTTTTSSNIDCDSSHRSLLLQPPVGPPNDISINEEDMAVTNNNKFHCSICLVSTNSEALLKSHLQGKKHKAKEARLGVDPTLNVTMPTTMTQWYCSLCQVSAASEKNLQDHLQGKKHKAKEVEEGKNPLENKQEKGCNTTVVETGEKSKNELETKEENKEMMKGEMSKYWHCKMCDVGTHDEATMDAHRKSEKHKEALKENCGGVIVVSTTMA